MHLLRNYRLAALLEFTVPLAILQYIGFVEAQYEYSIVLSFVNHTHINPKYIESFAASVSDDGNSGSYLSVQAALSKRVPRVTVHMTFDILRKNKSHMNLLNIDVDACKFLLGSYNQNYIKATWRKLQRISNFPKKCPLPAGKYWMHNFTMTAKDLPPVIPEMDWILMLEFRYESWHELDMMVGGSVRKV